MSEKPLKKRLNDEIGHHPVFTKKDKIAIFQAVDQKKSAPTNTLAKWISVFTMSGLAFALIFFVFHQLELSDQETAEEPISNPQISNLEILTKVDELEKSFRVGMTKEEIISMVGTEPQQTFHNSDSEDGTSYDMKFNLFTTDKENKQTGSEIDEQDLQNGTIGIQIFIGMLRNDTAARMSIFFLKENELLISFISEQTQFVEPVHPHEKAITEEVPEVIPIKLNSKEQQLYEKFVINPDIQQLVGVDPLTVAKLYVKAAYESRDDIQYELYTDREGDVQWSKEEHTKFPQSNPGDAGVFNHLDEGTFIQDEDGYSGYIQYENNGSLFGFQMIMNEDGIWQVAFMPIQ